MTEPVSPAFVQGWELLALAALGVAAGLIIAGVTHKAEDVFVADNPTPGGGSQTDFEKCISEVDAKLDQCLAKCPKNPDGKRDVWAEAGCWIEHTAGMAACIVLPQ